LTLGAADFSFSVIHTATNFLKLFKELHPTITLTIKDVQLLEAFTKYELALFEQSYLGTFKPELNGRYVATTSTHPLLLTPVPLDVMAYDTPVLLEENTNSENSIIELTDTTPIVDLSHLEIDSTLKVQITDIEGKPLASFSSLREAAKALDTNHIKLSRYAKSVDCVYIDYLGIKVNVECVGFVKYGKVVHATTKAHPPLAHSLSLKDGLIYAINKDLSQILKTFSSIYGAAKELGIDRKKIVRYIGTDFLIENKDQKFYLDATPETLNSISNNKPKVARSVYAHDLTTNIVTYFSSVTAAENRLNLHHDFINKHLDMDTVYISIDKTRKYKFSTNQPGTSN
jgi:hypothetical protein